MYFSLFSQTWSHWWYPLVSCCFYNSLMQHMWNDLTGNVPDASGASDGMVALDGYTCTWTSCTDGSANYRLNIECTDSKNVKL